MSKEKELLKVEGLHTDIISARGLYHTVREVSFDVRPGKILGIVGESGCGKSMTAKSILRLNPEDRTFYRGKILYRGSNGEQDLLKLKKSEIQALRGQEIAMISQNPMETFDPLYTVGNQMEEMLRYHRGFSTKRSGEGDGEASGTGGYFSW